MVIIRRLFIRNSFIASVFGSMALSCKGFLHPLKKDKPNGLSAEHLSTLQMVHDVLLPPEKNAPGASDINSLEYFKYLVNSYYFSTNDIQFIANGLRWVQETSIEMYGRLFSKLSENEKVEVIKELALFENSRRWISINLSYIMEALLGDPAYGGNANQKGWHWLKHIPGYPRPKPQQIYRVK